MKRFAKAGLIVGILAGLIVICRDLVMQIGWLQDEPLWYVGQAGYLTIIAAVVGAVLGTIIGASLFAVMVLVNRKQQKFAVAGLKLTVPLTATAAAVFLLGTYYPNPLQGVPELLMLSLVGLLAYVMMKRVGGEMTAGRLLSIAAGILSGEAFYLVVSRLPEKGLLPTHPVSYVLAAGVGIALGYLGYRLVSGVVTALAGRYSERASVYLIVGVLTVALMGFAGSGIVTQNAQFSPAEKLPTGKTSDDRPNVILISVDTLRPDYLGYNGGPARTPTIDKLASESYIFERAYSVAPWTRPSFASFFSSRYPAEMGVARVRGREEEGFGIIPYYWRQDRDLLAEVYKEIGYATMAVVTNVNLYPRSHADQGFDRYYHCTDKRDVYSPLLGSIFGFARLRTHRWLFPEQHERDLERAATVSTRGQELIPKTPSNPLLTWLHYMDPHQPYDAPSIPENQRITPQQAEARAGKTARTARLRTHYVSAYISEIEYCDQWLDRIIQRLQQAGLWDSAIIVFWSDHGEEFWEHDSWEHGQSLYNELLRVPLLIHLPNQTESKRINQPVTLLDVMPTLLELCQVSGPEGMRGRSLLPLLEERRGELAPLHAYLEGCVNRGIRKGLLTDRYKLIYDAYKDSFSLYNQHNDPGEQHNIYGTALAPDTRAMERDLLEWTELSLAMMDEYVESGGAGEVSPEVRQRLKDMGYIQ